MSLQTQKEVKVTHSRILNHIGINIYHMAITLQMADFLERHIFFTLKTASWRTWCCENVKFSEQFSFLGKHQ